MMNWSGGQGWNLYTGTQLLFDVFDSQVNNWNEFDYPARDWSPYFLTETITKNKYKDKLQR